MNPSDVRGALKADPFRPFTIVYKTGGVFPVRHGDDAWMHPNSGTTKVFVADGAGGFEILDASWILSLTFEDGASHRKAC